jgi:hypothetical protein
MWISQIKANSAELETFMVLSWFLGKKYLAAAKYPSKMACFGAPGSHFSGPLKRFSVFLFVIVEAHTAKSECLSAFPVLLPRRVRFQKREEALHRRRRRLHQDQHARDFEKTC